MAPLSRRIFSWMRVGLSLDTSTVQSSAGKKCSKTQKSQKDRMHRFRYTSEFNMLYPTKYVNLFLRVLPLLNFVIQNVNKMKKNEIHTFSQTFLVNKKDLTSEILTNKLNQLNFWVNYYKGATTHNHSCFLMMTYFFSHHHGSWEEWEDGCIWLVPSLKLTNRTWKWMVGRLVSLWDGLFSGAMLDGPMLNFHDYGRKGTSATSSHGCLRNPRYNRRAWPNGKVLDFLCCEWKKPGNQFWGCFFLEITVNM